ncbi:glycoside hydrolase family 88 protein [Brevundimonas sp. PAMC22021]|uniref:glycoside hydrolase family 88 protein n=1 Tax=Brevundimonas sp. PAMC22021 TaxID=2861285 RepID=UPI001C63A4D5|nr:glycoside hydrolase family 88 protein [Brevundimonas sp. PAMC22021]QYF88205.1 glycoside hydrolase family 88 protein [Brevundimonas sp. PAMC22021]
MHLFRPSRLGASLTVALLASTALAAPAYAQSGATLPPGVEAAWLTPPARPALNTDPRCLPSAEDTLAAVDYVTLSQIAAMAREPLALSTGSNLTQISSNWVAATFYVGAARVARRSRNPEILRFLTAAAEHYNYSVRGARSGPTMLNADDIAIGDLYEELYSRRRQEGTLLPLRQRLDWQVPHLNRSTETPALVWWWADALYMAPPVLARMSAITGDPKYLAAADKEWRRTADRLWMPEQRLFLRDERFVGRTEANGQPIYWSRANAWVIAGLARWLEAMPADYQGRDYYVDLFQKMAGRLAELQQDDGLWRASLLDPQSYPEAETSGSAFHVYALAWGVNHGLLGRETYLPHVLKGWAALNRHVLPSGLVGAAQKTGDQPVRTRPEEVGLYATGAYLLAGLEVADLNGSVKGLPVAEPARDTPEVIAATTPTPPAPVTIVGEEEIRRRAAEMQATAALAYDPAGLNRPSTIEPLQPPPADQQQPRAVVRFAPDRLDDLLWENDRVAHRIYGPALEAREPPSGSGVDVWAKRVRYPFMDRQLRFPNYHVDRGEGLDYYDVGRGRGAGGLGVWYENKLWTSRNFSTYRIDKTGGDEARFSVDYRPWPVDVVRRVWETRALSLPLGSNFTRMTSTLQSDTTDPLTVAIGISKRRNDAGSGTVVRDAANGRLMFWEPENPEHGSLGIAIAVDPAMVQGFAEDADNYLILLRVTPGRPFTYYMGSAWDRGLDFRTREAWESFVAEQAFDFSAAGAAR